MPQLTAADIYKGLTGQGLSPLAAAELTSISNRESGWNTAAESGYRPSTGDYFSTGLFQFNLGSAYGPGGASAGLGGTPDIWGGALTGVLGGNPYNLLMNDPNADYKAAAYAYGRDGLSPWQMQGGTPGTNVPTSAMQAAVDASGGAVTLAQLQAGLQSTGSSGNPLNYGTNTAGLAGAKSQQNDIKTQEAINEQLAAINAEYARQQSKFSQDLLGLQRESLGISEGGLERQIQEAPLLQADVQKLYDLQRQGILASGQDLNRHERQALTDLASSGASSGSLFTKGARDQHANIMADWASGTAQLQRQKQSLAATQNEEAIQYMERLAGMQDQKKQYDIMSKRYDISSEEIAARLQNTLGNISQGAFFTGLGLDQSLISSVLSMPSNFNYPPPGVTTGTAAPGMSPPSGGPGSYDPYNGYVPPNFNQPGATY